MPVPVVAVRFREDVSDDARSALRHGAAQAAAGLSGSRDLSWATRLAELSHHLTAGLAVEDGGEGSIAGARLQGITDGLIAALVPPVETVLVPNPRLHVVPKPRLTPSGWVNWAPPYQGSFDLLSDFFTSSKWSSQPQQASPIDPSDEHDVSDQSIAQTSTGEVGHLMLYQYKSAALDYSVQTASGSRLNVVGNLWTAPEGGTIQVQFALHPDEMSIKLDQFSPGWFAAVNDQSQVQVIVMMIDTATGVFFGPFVLGNLALLSGAIIGPGSTTINTIAVNKNQRFWVLAGLQSSFSVATNVGSLLAQFRGRAHVINLSVQIV